VSKYKNTGTVAGTTLSDAEFAFWTAVDAAEVARQLAYKSATTQAAIKAADVAYFRAVVAAEASNAVYAAEFARTALRGLTGGI
jgi:hypothetical protein